MNLLEIILEFQRRGLHIQDSPEKVAEAAEFFAEIGVTSSGARSILACAGERGWITALGEDVTEVIRMVATPPVLDDPKVKCGNCGWHGTESKMGKTLIQMHKLWDRVAPGEECPAGECPECSACVHLDRLAPRVYVYVEGGAVQGACGPAGMEFILMDKDNAAAGEEDNAQYKRDEVARVEDEAAGRVVGIF